MINAINPSSRTKWWTIAAAAWTATMSSAPSLGQSAAPAMLNEQTLRQRELDPKPFIAESLGLQINLPLGSTVVSEQVHRTLVISVTDSHEAPTWTMRIQSMTSTIENPTPARLVDDLLRELESQKVAFKLIANQPFGAVGSELGQLCYIERSNDQGDVYVTGRLVLPTGSQSFMVFALQTLPEHLPDLRPILEASYSTIRLESADEMASQRRARFEAGKAFLASVTPQRLKSLAGQAQWHRIYKPADPKSAAGNQEIGYTLVEVLEAPKGAMSEGRAEASYTAAERQTGLLVRVQARLVIDVPKRDFYDSIAQYWMTWDQSEEMWSLRGTRRQGDAEQSESESGIREPRTLGSLRPKLTVIKRTDSTEPVPYQWEVPDAYLSQALGWLVGRLLPKDIAEPREFAFYYFVSSNLTPKIYQRLDTWGPATDGSGNWVLTAKFTADSPPFTSIYCSDGKLIRRMHADGSITEPIELEQLHKLWKSKGLQIKSPAK